MKLVDRVHHATTEFGRSVQAVSRALVAVERTIGVELVRRTR
jgi:DNA-binding transcriptional LysR family regulator